MAANVLESYFTQKSIEIFIAPIVLYFLYRWIRKWDELSKSRTDDLKLFGELSATSRSQSVHIDNIEKDQDKMKEDLRNHGKEIQSIRENCIRNNHDDKKHN